MSQTPTVDVQRSAKRWTIAHQVGGLSLEVSPQRGEISSFALAGRRVWDTGPELNVWRAPTSNDGVKGKPEQWHAEWKPLGRFCEMGLDRIQRRSAEPPTLSRRRNGSVRVSLVHGWVATARDGTERCISHRQHYTLNPDGTLDTEHRFTLDPGLEDLPRIGVLLSMPEGFEALVWFGRGPGESYPDRKAASPVGRYTSTVTDEYVPYVVPQEHGLKTDVRWFELSHADAGRIRFLAGGQQPCFCFSASHFSPHDLTAAYHTYELRPRPHTVVAIDAAHRGLGTASCGPDTMQKYRLKARRYALRFKVQASQG